LRQALASFNGSQEASFDEMRKPYGTIEGYFAEGLGIDAAQQKALRNLYLSTQ
jgi:protein-tyrosine phosphatase